jgi:phosphoglycerate dehydrogenase-like enzyme
VILCNARGAHTPSTAEWVVTAVLAAQRGIPDLVREQDAGRWTPRTFPSVAGARVLVVGAGDTGRRVGRMLAGFDAEVTYVARTARDGVHATDELPRLLPGADVVVLLLPATPETTGLVDAAFLAARADGVLLVNAARGVVVDTGALLAELQSGRLVAGLDVTDPEPLPDGHPLWTEPRALITPHVANPPETMQRDLAKRVTENVRRFGAGEDLLAPIEPDRGY